MPLPTTDHDRSIPPQLKEALQNRDRRFQFLVDAVTNCAICMLDTTGHVATWNCGAQAVDGYVESEIVGQHFSVFFTPDDQKAGEPDRALTIARDNGRYATEALRVRKDGSQFWADVLIRPVYDSHGQHIGFARFVRDVSETKKIMDALRDSEQRFRLFVECVTDHALYMLDPAGIVTSWNIGAERIKGYKAEEIIGQHFSVFYTAADQDAGRPAEALHIAAETGKFAKEDWRVRKNGEVFAAEIVINATHNEFGLLIGFAKITRDVTQRKATEEAVAEIQRKQAIADERARGLDLLRETSQTLAKIVEAAPVGIVTVDGNDIVNGWNPAAERIYGMAAADVVGRRSQDIGRELPQIGPQRNPLLTDLVRNNGTANAVEARLRRKDGTIVELIRSGALIHDDSAIPGGMVLITEDVTLRNTAENHLRQAQKMEAIGQLTGGVAHDFNNILAIIHGNLELLSDELAADPAHIELIEAALAAAHRGASLTHRLLAYSRQQPLSPQVVTVGKLLTDLVAVLRRLLEETVEIETTISTDLWKIRIDPHQLENAIINLAVNARDAMPNGGRLTITACNAVLDEEYAAEHDEVTAGQYVALFVSDTGTGMNKEVILRALEPFYTTKPLGRGTGLGLSMVYGFVKQSEGHLTIYSEPGQGTTVKLYLRRSPDDYDLVKPAVDAITIAALERSNVLLIVEDDEAVRRLQVRTLNALGYRTLEAGDGPSGLALLDSDARIDLLLTDIVLPKGLDGVLFATAARRLRPGVKVIFSTGYAPNSVIRDNSLDGAIVLSKPFTRLALAQAVRTALSEETPK